MQIVIVLTSFVSTSTSRAHQSNSITISHIIIFHGTLVSGLPLHYCIYWKISSQKDCPTNSAFMIMSGKESSEPADPSKGKLEEKTNSRKASDKDLLWFNVEKVTEKDLRATASKSKKVVVNDETIALILHDNKIFAIQERCPHSGGPLHQGDIEDFEKEGLCISCPWHSWKFSLTTGKCVVPHRDDKCLKIYPVRIDPRGTEIQVGFDYIAESIFNSPP